MNFRQPPAPKGGLHRCIRMLSLLLLQHALAPSTIDAHARSRLPVNSEDTSSTDVASRPYLKVAGLLPLRIKAAPPPPDILGKPPAGAPPQPAQPVASMDTHTATLTPTTESTSSPVDSIPAEPVSAQPAHPVTNPPPRILPDDTRPSTRPEDFLPFFLFPGANQNVNVVVPVTPTRPPTPDRQLPPSSATYQQK
jgi:hypothetical protein